MDRVLKAHLLWDKANEPKLVLYVTNNRGVLYQSSSSVVVVKISLINWLTTEL